MVSSWIAEMGKVLARYISRLAIYSIFAISIFCTPACNSDRQFTFDPELIIGPIGVAAIPGTNLAVVLASNFNFEASEADPREAAGALAVIDLDALALVPELTLQIPNLGGDITIDAARQRIYTTDRDNDAVLVFDYEIPGAGGLPISITPASSVTTEEDPFAVILINSGTTSNIYTGNIESGDVSVISATSLDIIDADPGDDGREALPLDDLALGSVPAGSLLIRPNRTLSVPTTDLFFLGTATSGILYVIDGGDAIVEAAYDLNQINDAPSMRGMAITSTDVLFLGDQGARGFFALDISNLEDNGINNQLLETRFLGFVPTGTLIEDLLLDPTETKLYVANFDRRTISVYNPDTLALVRDIQVQQGPTKMTFNDGETLLLVTNFESDSVSVIDIATDTVLATLP